MRVLLTRPRDDSEATARELAARGHSAVIAPLLAIAFREGPQLSLDGVQAVLATSANGIRALARRTDRRDIAVFAVGPQTAEAARAAGFAAVRSADGDGAALARAVHGWADPAAGTLLHACGARTAGALAAALSAQGYDVRGEVLYEAVAAEHLPQAAAEALRGGALDAVMVYSPMTARIFARGVAAAGLKNAVAPLIAVAISAAAAEALAPLNFSAIRIAAAPGQGAMLAALGGGL